MDCSAGGCAWKRKRLVTCRQADGREAPRHAVGRHSDCLHRKSQSAYLEPQDTSLTWLGFPRGKYPTPLALTLAPGGHWRHGEALALTSTAVAKVLGQSLWLSPDLQEHVLPATPGVSLQITRVCAGNQNQHPLNCCTRWEEERSHRGEDRSHQAEGELQDWAEAS